MGKNSQIFMISNAKEKMIERFLLVEDQIKMVIYNTGSTLVFHMEMPSESQKGLTYDVVIEVPYSKKDENKGNNVFEFPMTVYSNCPSFIYSYAYIFYQRKLICKWLVNRYDKKTLSTPPTRKNEFGIIFYEKSIFFAVYYIYKNFNQSIMLLKKSATKASIGTIKSRITSQNDISANRRVLKEIEDKEKSGVTKKLSDKEKSRLIKSGEDNDKNVIRGIRRAKKPSGAKSARGVKKPKSAVGLKNLS